MNIDAFILLHIQLFQMLLEVLHRLYDNLSTAVEKSDGLVRTYACLCFFLILLAKGAIGSQIINHVHPHVILELLPHDSQAVGSFRLFCAQAVFDVVRLMNII